MRIPIQVNNENFEFKNLPPVEGARDIPPDETVSRLDSFISFKIKQFVGLKRSLVFATALGGAMVAMNRLRNYKRTSVKKLRVLITGGSRGLGFALAEHYIHQGASVIICGRNIKELKHAYNRLSRNGNRVEMCRCDITNPVEVKQLLKNVRAYFGEVDILVNNAGVIEVGPLDAFGFESFQKVVDSNLMGMIRVTLDFIPIMPPGARMINIISIGGSVAVPHLLPYTVSKFGALGFSLGLDAELSRRGISVTTVLPGLMRTGSFVHANFSGDAVKEFDWFALGAALPLVSISAKRAAKQIISSGQQRKRFVVLGPQAKFLRLIYQLFPELMLGLMRVAIRFFPAMPKQGGQKAVEGSQLRQDLPRGGVTRFGDKAGDELNENLVA